MTAGERRDGPAVEPGAIVKVLVVDDSAAVRRIVSGTLADEADFNVVGTARDGQHAITQVVALEPDVVVLDVEMPNLDGLATLPKLLEVRPHLPVVMYSTLTERGASATLEALARGAVDYATKPTMVANQEAAAAMIRRDLVPLVRTWGRIEQARRHRKTNASTVASAAPAASATERVVTRPAPRGQRIHAIVVGSSTGGPNALAEVVSGLPAALPVPVLIVQHMPEVFTRLLAERLDDRCLAPVVEAHQGDVVTPGTLYVAQGGTHLAVHREGTKVIADCTDGPPENFCRPAVDVLFRSAVDVWGSGILAVMLTGMGSDGLEGSRRVVEAGGSVLAQDEATSVVWGMPGAVAKAGLASQLLPLAEVARAIVERAMTPNMRVRT